MGVFLRVLPKKFWYATDLKKRGAHSGGSGVKRGGNVRKNPFQERGSRPPGAVS